MCLIIQLYVKYMSMFEKCSNKCVWGCVGVEMGCVCVGVCVGGVAGCEGVSVGVY